MKHDIEFFEEGHIYLVDGIITPSITQIIKAKFGGMYDYVSQATLEKAAEKGVAVHEAIELWEKEGKESDLIELANYKFLKNTFEWNTKGNEVQVVLEQDEEVIAAGTLDLLVEKDGKLGIGDIKRTARLNKEYLLYQLNLYRLAYQQTYGDNIDFLFGLHLRDNVRKKVDIAINEEKAGEIIELYYQSRG